MITLSDFGSRLNLHYNTDEEYTYIYANHTENFLEQFSDDLPQKYSDGARYLMMECITKGTFKELLAIATKIPGKDNLYEFTLGELPTKLVKMTTLDLYTILMNATLTGREFEWGGGGTFEEIEYLGKKYLCNYFRETIMEITPIKWIIDVKNHKIKSENVIAIERIYSVNEIIKHLTQPTPKKGIPYCISNNKFIINNGKITGFMLNSYNQYLNIPNYINELCIKERENQSIPYEESYKIVSIPSSVKKFETARRIETQTLELYDDTEICYVIYVTKKLILHYSSFEKLFIFLNNKDGCIKVDREAVEVCFVGKETLTKEQETIVKNYFPKYKWLQEQAKEEKKEETKESITQEKQEETPEKNELSISLEKLYKVLTYYEIGKEETRITKEEVSEYKQKLKDLEKRFYDGEEDIESPEAVYNEFLLRIKEKLATYEKDAEYHKIIDLIEICKKAINGETKNIDNEFVGDLYNVSNVILPYLKNSYHKYYKQAMLDILSNEMKTISAYINGKGEIPDYTNTAEFIKHYLKSFIPLLMEINLALNDEATKRNIAEEIMQVVASNMSLEFENAKYEIIARNLEYLQELSKTLDKKISISPFKQKYNKDKETILSFVKKINEYYSDKDIRDTLLSSCDTLKKYLAKKPEQFVEIDRLINEILNNNSNDDKIIELYEQIINMQTKGFAKAIDPNAELESIPFDKDNTETKQIINALCEILKILHLLELEVDDSIEKKKAFMRCKIID